MSVFVYILLFFVGYIWYYKRKVTDKFNKIHVVLIILMQNFPKGTWNADVDLTNKVYIVTGANVGKIQNWNIILNFLKAYFILL